LIEFTSYLALFATRVLWRRIRGCKFVVIDRCPLDLAAWIYSISSYLPRWLFLVLISLSKSLNAVVLCAPREVLAKRKPEELRPKTLKFYESLCKSGIIKTVDASKPLEEVVSEVVKQIDDHLLRAVGGGEELGH
jgi:thymidylate kinase